VTRSTNLLTVVAAIGTWTVAVSSSVAQELTGEIRIDGSSTVYLISEAMATRFKQLHPKVNITVGISGTGGGFKKFANGETDIQDASRPIRPPEIEACKKNGIRYLELQVAFDGLAVVIHPENTWARKMTVEQLRKIWHPETAAKKWSDVDPTWPNQPIVLFGAGPDSGTFDYFTEVICGKEKVSRSDYQASEDDNNTVRGVAGNKYALGYFGVAYYEENRDKLQVVAIAPRAGEEYVLPTPENVLSGKYRPLGRPLFIYVRLDSLRRPEVREFVRFYLRRGDIVDSSKYIRLPARLQNQQQQKLEKTLASLD